MLLVVKMLSFKSQLVNHNLAAPRKMFFLLKNIAKIKDKIAKNSNYKHKAAEKTLLVFTAHWYNLHHTVLSL